MKVFKRIIRFLFGLCALCLVLFLSFCDRYFSLEEDHCLDKGLIWDDDERRCRDDCLTFVKGKGCISLEVLSQIDQEICGGAICTPEQKLLASKRKCEIYKGAIDQRDGYCDETFQLKDCGQLKENWLYPKECGLPPEQTF